MSTFPMGTFRAFLFVEAIPFNRDIQIIEII